MASTTTAAASLAAPVVAPAVAPVVAPVQGRPEQGEWLWKLVVLALGAWAAWTLVRRVRRRLVETRTPAAARVSSEFRQHSPEDYDAACEALAAFTREYAGSFQSPRDAERDAGPRGGCTRGTVLSLNRLRGQALARLHALRRALPNDLALERALVQHTEDVDAGLRAWIEDAQRRAGCELLFTGPLDDWFYRKRYRAANDVVA